MYTLKVVNEHYIAPGAYGRVGRYVTNVNKTDGYYESYGVLTGQEDSIENSMNAVYIRRTTYEDISCQFHVVISFKIPNTDENVFAIYELSRGIVDYIGDDYQVVAGLHHMDLTDANENPYPHIHLQINAVSWRTGDHIANNEKGRRMVREMVNDAIAFAKTYVNTTNLH